VRLSDHERGDKHSNGCRDDRCRCMRGLGMVDSPGPLGQLAHEGLGAGGHGGFPGPQLHRVCAVQGSAGASGGSRHRDAAAGWCWGLCTGVRGQ